MSKVVTLDNNNFEKTINGDLPVLVDFWATWCMPCRMQAPVLEELSEEFSGYAIIGKVNVDENESLAIKYKVNAIPYLCVFKNGELVGSKTGLSSKEELALLIKKFM